MLKLFSLSILLCLVMPSYGQFKADKVPSTLISALQKSKPDTNRIKLLFQLSDFYLNNPIQNKTGYDSTLFYLQEAVRIADAIRVVKWRYEAYERLGKYYFTRKDSKDGIKSFIKIIGELNKSGDKKAELVVWEELSKLIPPRDTFGLTRLECLEKIVSLYKQMDKQEEEIDALKNIADLHLNLGQLDIAEAELLEILRRYKAINYPYLHYTYDLLAVTNRFKGDFNKAVFYALKTVESMEATHDSAAATTFYSRLANIYRELDEPENSVKWYWKVFYTRRYTGPINLYMFRDAGFLARELIKLNKGKEALAFILDIAGKNKPIGP
jgi:tetratricopeptide (TPR) repeat protein